MSGILTVALGLGAVAMCVQLGTAQARYRRRKRLFGSDWGQNPDLVRLRKVGGAVVYASRRLYPQAVGHTPGTLKGEKQFNAMVSCARMLIGELSWIDDAPGLDSCGDEVWRFRLSALRGGLAVLKAAQAGFEECSSGSPSRDEFFEACGKLMLALDLTHRAVEALWALA